MPQTEPTVRAPMQFRRTFGPKVVNPELNKSRGTGWGWYLNQGVWLRHVYVWRSDRGTASKYALSAALLLSLSERINQHFLPAITKYFLKAAFERLRRLRGTSLRVVTHGTTSRCPSPVRMRSPSVRVRSEEHTSELQSLRHLV